MLCLSLPTTKKLSTRISTKIFYLIISMSITWISMAQDTNQLYKHAIGYKYTTLCQGVIFRTKIDQSALLEAFAGPIENDPNKRTTVLGVRYIYTFLQEKDYPMNPYIFGGFGYAASEIKHIGCKMKDPSDIYNLYGYSAGIGLELKMTDRISLNAEAARMTLFNTVKKAPNLDGISLNFGINYSFGGID